MTILLRKLTEENVCLWLQTHNLRDNYNFHSYMIRCMEDEFETLVGIRYDGWMLCARTKS